MSANSISITDAVDCSGMTFEEASEALVDAKAVKGVVSKKPDGASGKWAFCFSFSPTDYDETELLEVIGSEYGPGDYPVQYKAKNENNKEVIRWQKNFQVQQRRLGAQAPQPATPAPVPASSDGLGVALTQIADTQLRILEALSSRPEPPPQKTTIEIAQELAALKDLFSDNKQTVLEQVKDVLELKQMLTDDGDTPSDPIAAALKYLGPAIEKGIESQPQAPVAGAARVVPEISPEQAKDHAPAPGAVPMQLQIDQAFQFFAENYLPASIQLAESKQEPQRVASYLVRLIGTDELSLQRIGLVVSQDDMVQRFAGFDPRVMDFATWFDDVADWLAHALWPETNPAPDPVSATINATIDDQDNAGDNNGAKPQGDTDPQGDLDDEIVAGDDAQHTDPPRAGIDDDA